MKRVCAGDSGRSGVGLSDEGPIAGVVGMGVEGSGRSQAAAARSYGVVPGDFGWRWREAGVMDCDGGLAGWWEVWLGVVEGAA